MYNLNALESLASAMEISSISARNGARLAYHHLHGQASEPTPPPLPGWTLVSKTQKMYMLVPTTTTTEANLLFFEIFILSFKFTSIFNLPITFTEYACVLFKFTLCWDDSCQRYGTMNSMATRWI